MLKTYFITSSKKAELKVLLAKQLFMPIKIILVFLLIHFFGPIGAQPANTRVPLPPLQTPALQWADSVYNNLNLEQKIGQLFMIAAYSGGEKYNQPLIEKLILENGIGGLIFMQGTPKAQAEQTNKYQLMSKVPLLIGMDAEWGLGMRLTGIKDMPRQLMLGAMKDSTLVYKMSSAIASQCRRMGVHINFAPVVDVNNNPDNPVINFRSYGENKNKVSTFALQYMRGLQENGVMACAKHFPGHGDTDLDSHKDLPQINKTPAELEAMELFPFAKLIENGVQSVMVAHLQIPALEPAPNTPTTLSYKVISDLLMGKMGFKGLIFTDALNMQGVAKYYSPGEIDLKAFEAGNDVLLFSQDVKAGIQLIKNALTKGLISEDRLAISVKKILAAKFNAGLNKIEKINSDSVDEELNQYTSSIRKQVAEASATLLADPNQIIQKLKNYEMNKVAYVAVGTGTENVFIRELKKYGVSKIFFAPTKPKEIKDFVKRFKNTESVIIGIHNMSGYPTNNFGLDSNEISVVNGLIGNKNTLTVLFGNPYALKYFCNSSGMVVTYDEADETQEIAAKIITGQLKTKGRLPVSVCPSFKLDDGIVSMTNVLGEVIDTSGYRLQNRGVDALTQGTKAKLFNDVILECCVSPQAVGADIVELDKLDVLIENAIRQGAFPGCRILAAKDGKVFYDKAFGYLTQDKKNMVDINTVYDLASVTKVASTTLAVMKLYEEGKINLDAYLGKYLSGTKGTDKEYIKIKDILTHQAGLKSWIPFYKETLDDYGFPKKDIYSKEMNGKYKLKVADNLFIHSSWQDTMWKRILYSPLENRGRYVYSDLDFIFLQKLVEQITGKTLDVYVQEQFYKPLGLTTTAYNPKSKLKNVEIAPTEYDNYFRYQIISGYVHDMGAAMLGGVGGHAGLFSTANDVGILFQMLLNGGVYNKRRYFQKSTVDLFTAKNSFISRRGLGFDKPEVVAGRSSPCTDNASPKTFGHQGFTGTCVWADPESNLLFVFLSNRTYPSSDNKLINSMGIRERAQRMIYNSLGIAPKTRK